MYKKIIVLVCLFLITNIAQADEVKNKKDYGDFTFYERGEYFCESGVHGPIDDASYVGTTCVAKKRYEETRINKYCLGTSNNYNKDKCKYYCKFVQSRYDYCKSPLTKKQVDKYCLKTSANFNSEKCARYCKIVNSEYDSCQPQNQVNKTTTMVATAEKTAAQTNEMNEEKKENEMEKQKQERIEKIKNEIQKVNSEIETIAQEQNKAEEKIRNKNRIRTFFFGNDPENLQELKSVSERSQSKIEELETLLKENEDEENSALIQEKIDYIKSQQNITQKAINKYESKFSLFGWIKNIF